MLLDWMVAIFPLLWSFSHACNPNENCSIDDSNENIQRLLASMDYITTQLIQTMMYNPTVTASVVVSPVSIYNDLFLMLFGSAGDTQKELITALKLENADLQGLAESFGDILIATDVTRSTMVGSEEDILLKGHVAEGIFIQKDYTLVDTYADYLKALNIQTQPTDFVANNMQDAANAIRNWITATKPKSDVSSEAFSTNQNTRMVFTSLFYFTVKWYKNLFMNQGTVNVPFNSLNAGAVDVPMMTTVFALNYYDDIKHACSVLLLPFQGLLDYEALFILPNQGVDAVQFVKSFTMNIVDDFYENAHKANIECQIPKFSISYSITLNDQLRALGIEKLFGATDWSNMLKDVGIMDLGVQVLTTSEITLNEKGVNANDLNVEQSTDTSPLPQNTIKFIADRPFLLLVRCINTRVFVFATFVTNP